MEWTQMGDGLDCRTDRTDGMTQSSSGRWDGTDGVGWTGQLLMDTDGDDNNFVSLCFGLSLRFVVSLWGDVGWSSSFRFSPS